MYKDDAAQIGINAHLLSGSQGYRRAGIHHYIAEVIANLPQGSTKFEYTIFLQQNVHLQERPDFTFRNSGWPTERRIIRIFWEQTAWPMAAAKQKIDLLHSMAFVMPLIGNIPTVVTVYDLSFVHYPQSFPNLQRLYLQSQTSRSCRQAKRIITISESSRQDVHRLFRVPLERIDVVVPGVDSIYQPYPQDVVDRFREEKNFRKHTILHVGTLQPRKNIPLLLQAVAELGRPDVDLVLVGAKGWLYEDIFAQVIKLGIDDQVHFAGYVPDDELPLWYNSASMLAFPSAYEGFGLPVVEAMACGTPVVAARSSSIPEAGGSAALYFDPGDVKELVSHMAAIIENASLAGTMREKGITQAKQFSWERAGQETTQVYQRALGLL